MATKADLQDWVVEAVNSLGGSAGVVAVSRKVWELHEDELRASGDLFFTWQYDIRWEAQKLRDSGRLAPANGSRSGLWKLPG